MVDFRQISVISLIYKSIISRRVFNIYFSCDMLFCCPKCKKELFASDRSYRCADGHVFDTARQGYVNLLTTSNKIKHGDDDLMLHSRRRFLDAGFYGIFADKLCDLVSRYITCDIDVILDCGCGEGYYTGKIREKIPHNPIAGFDVAKKAVSLAAGKYKDIDFAVASSRDIPLPSNFVKILTNIFSPMEPSEFHRVLTDDGVLIYAVPGKRHLWGLKELIYEEPYENKETNTKYEGFELIARVPVKDEISLTSSLLLDLFAMTPYYYRSPKGTLEKLNATEELSTEIEFDFLIYKKR